MINKSQLRLSSAKFQKCAMENDQNDPTNAVLRISRAMGSMAKMVGILLARSPNDQQVVGK